MPARGAARASTSSSGAGTFKGATAKRKPDGTFDNAQRATEPKTEEIAERMLPLPSQGGPSLVNGHHPACYLEDPGKPGVTRDLEGKIIGEPCPNGCGPAEG